MTFKHKLAKRLAQNGPAVATAFHAAPAPGAAAGQRSRPASSDSSRILSTPSSPGTPLRIRVLFILSLLAAVACEQGPATSPEVQSNIIQIGVWPKHMTVGLGESAQFVAFGRTSANDSVAAVVTWSASAGAITPDGIFTADMDTGAVTVTATHAQKLWLSDSSAVSVLSISPDLVQLLIWPRDAVMAPGDSLDLWAFGVNSVGDTSLVEVTWTAEGGTVQSKGIGRGLYKPDSPGQHRVIARADPLADSTTVTVGTIPVASVGVTPPSASVLVGQTVQLTATPRDAAGNPLTGRVVTWSTSASGVATVNNSGLVTAQGQGSATITATSEGQSGTASITVSIIPVASVTVSPSSLNLSVGQTGQLTATPRDAAGNPLTGRVVTWSTSASNVATVNNNGVVTAQAEGTATITAASEGQSGTASVTVTAAGTSSLVFASDWSSGSPSDGGRWTETDSPGSINVVSTASVGGTWPSGMTNVLRVGYNSSNFSSVAAQNGWPLPAVGEYVFRRLGIRVNVDSFGGESDHDHHPVQSMGVGASSCAYAAEYVLYHSASNYQFQLANLNNGSSQPMYRWNVNASWALSNYYQIEERYYRTGTSTYNLEIRVYNAAGTQIHSSADFRDALGSGATLGSVPPPSIAIQASGDGGACLRHMNIGNQGRNYGATEYIYYGGFAVRISSNPNDWIGPYQAGEQ